MSSAISFTAASWSPRSCVSMKPRSSSRSCSESSASPLHSPRGRRRAVAERRAGALQRAVDRGDARLERVGGLLGGELEHVAQDQHRALAGGQDLDQREEAELDRLARDDDRVGLVGARGDLVEQPVGIGLQPRDLGERADLLRPAALAADRVQARVGGDPVQPGAEPGAALELVAVAPGAQEGLLHEVLGLVEGAEHAVAVDVQLALVAVDVLGELVLGGGVMPRSTTDGAGAHRSAASGAGARRPRPRPAPAGCRPARTATSARRPSRARRARPR